MSKLANILDAIRMTTIAIILLKERNVSEETKVSCMKG